MSFKTVKICILIYDYDYACILSSPFFLIQAMDVDDSSANAGSSAAGDNSQSPASLHRAGKNFVTEPDDDGWVTVTKSKKH